MNVSSYKTSFIRVLQLSQYSCTLLALLPLNLTQWERKSSFASQRATPLPLLYNKTETGRGAVRINLSH